MFKTNENGAIPIADICTLNKHGTVYPKKYAHDFCFPVLCCGYTLTDFPISTRLTSLAPWQSNDCPSAGKATLMNMDKYFMWNHYERLHNHNKESTTKPCAYLLGNTVCAYNPRVLNIPTVAKMNCLSGHVNKPSKQCTHCVGCLHVTLIIQAYYKKWLSRYCQRDSAGEVMGKHSYVQSMSF